jgi:hypothetical protein
VQLGLKPCYSWPPVVDEGLAGLGVAHRSGRPQTVYSRW